MDAQQLVDAWYAAHPLAIADQAARAALIAAVAAALAAAYERGRNDESEGRRERRLAEWGDDYDYERQSEILRGLHSRGS